MKSINDGLLAPVLVLAELSGIILPGVILPGSGDFGELPGESPLVIPPNLEKIESLIQLNPEL